MATMSNGAMYDILPYALFIVFSPNSFSRAEKALASSSFTSDSSYKEGSTRKDTIVGGKSTLAGEVPPPLLTLAFPFTWVNSLGGGHVCCVLGGALITFIELEPLCFFFGRTSGLGTIPHLPRRRGKRELLR